MALPSLTGGCYFPADRWFIDLINDQCLHSVRFASVLRLEIRLELG
jgi:hypothetical protein